MSVPERAEISQLGNDLYWKLWAGPDKFIRWTGYNDRNWWDNVSIRDTDRRRVGPVTGRSFTINFATGEVEIEPAQVAAWPR